MKIQKILNLQSQYSIDGEQVAFFGGQVNEDGTCNTNRNIANEEIYRANQDTVLNAFKEFENEVFKIADGVKEGGLLCE